MRKRDAIVAGAWAAVLSGAPSTISAFATGRDPLEATKAAGSILLRRETRTPALVAAAVPVHLVLSLGWALVLDRARVRGPGHGAAAGLLIAALDLGLAGRRYPRLRDLPLAPQVADHVAYGAVVGIVLARRCHD
ncbi:MAG TPA: hypothetical protein VNP93_11630 [Gaiellaceae bacterium]|nr:hypothetical protein [Gaiellaceae bacterium]